jgi:uncharacterized protein with HEPN domain
MYVDDMIDVCHRVLRYTEGVDRAGFVAGTMMHDAVLRNLEILGEAAKQVPESLRVLAPAIAWRRVSGLRDILAHAYFGIDEDIVWDVVSVEVPALLPQLVALRAALDQ